MASGGAVVSQTQRQPELVAGRYAIESVIAKGGMGAVYRAFDRTQNRSVALKRLLTEGDTRRRTRMFEREFYTLSGLKHPRIIEVYEYGIDQDGAYYTMELLGGRDLRELAPLPYRTACRYLRDVANSLALLHARGLLHRDISPRNVRITDDDRAKLIDFGTLSSFGRSTEVMGTAPGIPPETLYGAALDQRADLYSLGALAYWMVTGRHAYHVRSIDQLPDAWRRPLPAPSLLVPKTEGFEPLPPELDELIVALLDQNPLARPVNAGEVVARLAVIAQLPSDDEPLSALSYLHGGKTVGRARQRAKLRRYVKSAINGRGTLATLEAEAGMGSGRLLADLAIEARLLGATAIVVDAGAHFGAYGVVDEIARALFAIDPEKARAAMGEHASVLARFVPDAAAHTSVRPTQAKLEPGADPREARMRVQTALFEWIERFAKYTPLVLGIRALHRADDASVALLSALAHGVQARRILLALAFDPDELASAVPAVAGLLKIAGVTLKLHGLRREEVQAMVRETFGTIRNSERLAEWLHELTSGKPQGCIDLLQHLIEQDVIRFIDGVWVLPQELLRDALPADIGQALDARLARLSVDGYKLARALSVARTATPIERCLALARLEGIAEPLKALSELAQRGVVAASEDDVRFSHRAMHDAVLRRLDDAERRRLHVQFGGLLEREGRGDLQAMLDAGWHLLHGGEERRGAELLADLGAVRSTDDALYDLTSALEAALEVYRRLDYPKSEQARVLTSVVTAGFFFDRRVVERYGDEALQTMQDVLGLSIARKWQPRLGSHLALWLGLGCAFVRMLRIGPRRAVQRFSEAIPLFCVTVISVVAYAAVTMDPAKARQAATALDPLRALGPDSAPFILSEYARALAKLPEDRLVPTIAGCRWVTERTRSTRAILGFTPEMRRMMLINALYAWGSLEALREDPEALRLADELDSHGLKLGNLYADQIRACYHGVRGESALADEYRTRVELLALQAGSGWLAEIWSPTSAILFYMMSRDGVGLRRVMGELDRLGAAIPSLQRYARLARASYHAVHGDDAAAGEAIGDLIDAAPLSFIGWTAMVGRAVRVEARTGDRERARALGERALSQLDAEDRQVTTMLVPLITELALLEAELGEPGAARRIDDYLTEIGERGGPITRGTLHEARAEIALMFGDGLAARQQLAHVKHWFLPTANPVLVGRCERLQREIASGSVDMTARGTRDLGPPSLEMVRAVMRDCVTAKDRAAGALDLLLKEAGAASGYLFGCEESELVLLCQRGDDVPSADLRARVLTEIECSAYGDRDASSIATRVEPPSVRSALQSGYRVIVLADRKRIGRRVIAAAAITEHRGSLRTLEPSFLAAVADGLAETTSTTHPSESA
jgi:serine/threonine-protein kinase